MRVLFALVLFTLAAAEQIQVVPQLFQSGEEYFYDARLSVASGAPQQTQLQVSGVEYKAVLNCVAQDASGRSQQLICQLLNVKQAAFDKSVRALDEPIPNLYHREYPEHQAEIAGPVFFHVKDNKIEGLSAPKGMPEKAINLYRGIATVLSLSNPSSKKVPFSKAPQLTEEDDVVKYSVYEEGINGNCKTHYIVLSDPEDQSQLNITKRKNHDDCIGEQPLFEYDGHDQQGCDRVCLQHNPEQIDENLEPEMADYVDPYDAGCPAGYHPEQSLGQSYLNVWYNISSQSSNEGVIEGAKAIDRKVLRHGHIKLVVLSTVELQLLQQTRATKRWQEGQNKQYDDLTFQMPKRHYINSQKQVDIDYLALYAPLNPEELKHAARVMVDDLAQGIAADNLNVPIHHGPKVTQLVKALSVLPKKSLQELWQSIVPLKDVYICTEKQYLERKILLDTMALAGSNDAALFVLDLVKERRLTNVESIEGVTALQGSVVNPSNRVIDVVLELCTDDEFQKNRTFFSAACTTLAKLVDDNCEDEHQQQKKYQQNKLQQQEQSSEEEDDEDQLQHQSKKQQRRQQQHQHRNQQKQSSEEESEEEQQHSKKQKRRQQKRSQHQQSSEESEDEDEDKCNDRHARRVIQEIAKELKKADEPHEKIILLQTLGQMSHPEAIEAILPYATGEEQSCGESPDEDEDHSDVCQYLRLNAIYALHHSVQEHAPAVQPIVEAIYNDEEEDYEIRIAAFSVFLAAKPAEPQLARVVMDLPNEEDPQVASFVYSALRSTANSTLPCMQQTRRRIQKLLAALPQQSFGVQYSKFKTVTTYDKHASSGVKMHAELIQSNNTAFPRAGYFDATFSKAPLISTMASVSFIQKGLQLDALEDIFLGESSPAEVLSQALKRIRRSLRQREDSSDSQSTEDEDTVQGVLSTIERQLNIQPADDEVPRLALSFKLLGQELSTVLDEEHVQQLVQQFARNIQKYWSQPVNGRYTKVLMPYTYQQMSYSVAGLPVVLSNRHPIIVTVAVKDFQLRLKPQPDSFIPEVFAVSAYVKPTVYYTQFSFAYTITPFTRSALGVRVMEKTKATLPIDVAFAYSDYNNTASITVRPRYTKLAEHRTDVLTFATRAQIIGAPRRYWLEHTTLARKNPQPFQYEETFGHETLGAGIRVVGVSNRWDYDVPVPHTTTAFQKGFLAALVKTVNNPKASFRDWQVFSERSEESPVDEVTLTAKWYDNEDENAYTEEPEESSEESGEDSGEEAWAPELQVPCFEEEHKAVTGQEPEQPDLDQLLQEVARKQDRHIQLANPQLRDIIKPNTTWASIIQYVLSAKGPAETNGVVGYLFTASSFDETVQLAKFVADAVDSDNEVEVHAVIASSPRINPFESEVPNEDDQKMVAAAEIEFQTEETGKQKAEFKVEMSKSDEQQEGLTTPNGQEVKPWFYAECEKDDEDLVPACDQVRRHKARLNNIEIEVKLPEDVPDVIADVAHCAREHAKVLLYQHMQADYTQENGDDFLKMEIEISEQPEQFKLATVNVSTPDDENLSFQKLKWLEPFIPSTHLSVPERFYALIAGGDPYPKCVVGNSNLTTFDNSTISLDAVNDNCQYILARDCDEEPDFTIIADPQRNSDDQYVHVIFYNETILTLRPAEGNSYKVRVNGSNTLHVTRTQNFVIKHSQYNDSLTQLYVTEHQGQGPVLWLDSQNPPIRVVYNGQYVKIEVQESDYSGQMCGLCGTMSADPSDDQTGPQQCEYEEEEDFINSWAFGEHACPVKAPKGEYECPEGAQPRGGHGPRQQNKKQSSLRHKKQQQQEEFQESNESQSNEEEQDQESSFESQCKTSQHVVKERAEKVCVSVHPVPKCEKHCIQTASKQQEVEFACVPKKHPAAKKISKDAQSGRPIRLPKNLKPSYHKEIEVARSCQPKSS